MRRLIAMPNVLGRRAIIATALLAVAAGVAGCEQPRTEPDTVYEMLNS